MINTKRNNKNQVITIEKPIDIRPTIKFNYSENFNRVVELNIENYNRWRAKTLHLLSINDIVGYITKEE